MRISLYSKKRRMHLAASICCCLALAVAASAEARGAAGLPELPKLPALSERATGMLKQLYGAAKRRADRVRAAEGRPASVSTTDMMAMALDYARDKLENPPLQAVEENLVMLNRNLRRLTRELRRVAAATPTGSEAGCRVCDEVLADAALVPVQGEKYSVIKKKKKEGG